MPERRDKVLRPGKRPETGWSLPRAPSHQLGGQDQVW